MKKITTGILAHVDAGKTTLSEGLLYLAGCIRRRGRVDHRDTFFDTANIERQRGITVFSKQAIMETPDTTIYLLDTPGHTDFSAEMERTLDVLDYAILVLSAVDGIQLHTETVWRLLRRRGIPTFIFINKTDLPGKDHDSLLEELHARLSPNCLDFGLSAKDQELFDEQCAMCEEQLMEEYLDTGFLHTGSITDAIASCLLFPCYFGSALKMEGIPTFFAGFERFTREPPRGEAFSARVFKIGRDPQGNRLTYMKLLGGSLKVKTTLTASCAPEEKDYWEEKIDQIRLYSGEKYRVADTVFAGDVCCVTGLTHLLPGHGTGEAEQSPLPVLQPVLSYHVILPPDTPVQPAYQKLAQLAEEDAQLHLRWDAELREIYISLMGEIQMEILQQTIRERFGMEVSFDSGSIVYQETIAEAVECAGHFEPLRHYAEVHLLLEPGEPGSGITFDSICPENTLAGNWQRLILSQLEEELPPGVLTGFPLTDLRITLTGGRAHIKHTEGGDFLQAAKRALRQGLMKARENGTAVLLEPWYAFVCMLPTACTGRAMSDLDRMSAVIRSTEIDTTSGMHILKGCAPAAALRGYPAAIQSFTRGQGKISLSFHGYAPCHNTEDVVRSIGYIPERDTRNPADSVFCASGAGYTVLWTEADAHMHTCSIFTAAKPKTADTKTKISARTLASKSGMRHTKPCSYADAVAEDRELKEIFERTYGPIPTRSIFVPPPPATEVKPNRETYLSAMDPTEDYLLVDGYNIIFSWEELKTLARDSLDLARQTLIHILTNYQGYKKYNLILVFDAWRVKEGRGAIEKHGGIYVIYTREKETADTYIEKVTYDIGRQHRVRVATSDAMEQVIILGHGASRMSATNLHEEVMTVMDEIRSHLQTDDKSRHPFLK